MVSNNRHRLTTITLDEQTLNTTTPEIENERKSAVTDLLAESHFLIPDHDGGPYTLKLGLHEGKLRMDIGDESGSIVTHLLSLTPFRRIIAEYFAICDSYYVAVKKGRAEHIQAIDMGRRGLHNDGSERLKERLEGKITIDFETARRLFTLICALTWQGRLL